MLRSEKSEIEMMKAESQKATKEALGSSCIDKRGTA